MNYTRPGEHFNFTTSGSAFTGYFPDNKDNPWYDSYAAGLNLSWTPDLTQRTHFHLNQAASASTDLRLGGILGTGGAGGSIGNANTSFDNSLVREPSITSETLAELSHDFSLKSSVSVYYGYRVSHFFSDASSDADFGTSTIGTRYRHKLTKNLGYHLGYGYSHTNYFSRQEAPPDHQNIDTGLDYGRAVSLTRTTQLSFGAGTAIASGGHLGSGEGGSDGAHVFATGNVSLAQELGRTWALNASYARLLSYETGFSQPGLFDTANLSLAGLISRRVDVSAGATYQNGRIGLHTSNYESWSAVTQIRSAITRNIAAYAYYYYFLTDVGPGVILPPGFPRHADRNGVRAGVTAWVPLWYGRGAP